MKRQANTTLFFYQNGGLSTELSQDNPVTIFRADGRPLAEQHTGDAGTPGLLATDDKGSVLTMQSNKEEEDHAYSAYGHDPTQPSKQTMAGFNGERIEDMAVGYLLGNGYRLYNPALMRFHAPDSLSPFDKGGFNSYSYCQDDPINFTDPTGHFWQRALIALGFKRKYAGVSELIKSTSHISKSLVNRDYNLPNYKEALRRFGYEGVPSPNYEPFPVAGQTVLTEPNFKDVPIDIKRNEITNMFRTINPRRAHLKQKLDNLDRTLPESEQLAGQYTSELIELEITDRALLIRADRLNIDGRRRSINPA